MNTITRRLFPLAAFCLIATGATLAPANADMDVVAVLATQTRLVSDAELFELGVDRQKLVQEFRKELNQQLENRLLDEFETSKRTMLLAADFTRQILESLDERLPTEVENLISTLN